MLTALGIIFGVAAVITMMAIGAGAQQEILDQMKLVGVNNILITPKPEKGSGDSQDSEESGGQDVGIRKDQKRISIIPFINFHLLHLHSLSQNNH